MYAYCILHFKLYEREEHNNLQYPDVRCRHNQHDKSIHWFICIITRHRSNISGNLLILGGKTVILRMMNTITLPLVWGKTSGSCTEIDYKPDLLDMYHCLFKRQGRRSFYLLGIIAQMQQGWYKNNEQRCDVAKCICTSICLSSEMLRKLWLMCAVQYQYLDVFFVESYCTMFCTICMYLNVKVRVYSTDMSSRFSGLYINYPHVLELSLSKSNLLGRNTTHFLQLKTFTQYQLFVPYDTNSCQVARSGVDSKLAQSFTHNRRCGKRAAEPLVSGRTP